MSQVSSKKISRFFNIAREASYNSDFKQHHLGAVLVYKGLPLATGFNSKKTNPIQKYYNKEREDYDINADCFHNNSLHAEMACLNKVRYLEIDFSKTAIFVYREHKDGHKGLARPCEACRKRMLDMGVHDVYYTTESGWCYERID